MSSILSALQYTGILGRILKMKKEIVNNSYVKKICKFIKSYFSDEKTAQYSIKAVYLFGSVLDSNKFKYNSDVDIAFLVDKDLYKDDPLLASSASYSLATEISLMLDRQTDVTILNSASIETAYQVIVAGSLVYEFDNNLRIDYEIALKGLYFDFKPFLNTLRSQHISKLNESTRTL